MTDFLRDLATVLLGAGGVSALLAALLKSWFGLQMEKFKREQSVQLEAIKTELNLVAKLRGTAEEKKAQVASEVLVGALRFLDALSSVVSPGMWAAPPGTEHDSMMAVEHQARWKFVEPFAEEFRRGWISAEVFLPKEASDLLELLWKQKTAIEANQAIAITMANHRGPGLDRSFHKQSFGSQPQKVLDDLRDTLKRTLRPLAQLESAVAHPAA